MTTTEKTAERLLGVLGIATDFWRFYRLRG
jgi:hypothetical protein